MILCHKHVTDEGGVFFSMGKGNAIVFNKERMLLA